MNRFSVNRASLRSAVVAIATTATLGLASAAAAASFADGDFSTPPVGGNFATYSNGQSIGPWTVTGASVDLIGNYWSAPTPGGHSVDLDGNAPGGVTQTFDIAPGKYLLTFFLSGNPDGAPTDKTLNVSVGNVAAAPFDYLMSGNTHGDMQYATETLPFVVTGLTGTTLSFSSTDSASPYGPVIGGVSIAAVPEPASWALLLMGIASIGGGLRLQRAKGLATA